MEDIWQRLIGDLVGRLDGPLHFRFIVQPLMAVAFAIVALVGLIAAIGRLMSDR